MKQFFLKCTFICMQVWTGLNSCEPLSKKSNDNQCFFSPPQVIFVPLVSTAPWVLPRQRPVRTAPSWTTLGHPAATSAQQGTIVSTVTVPTAVAKDTTAQQAPVPTCSRAQLELLATQLACRMCPTAHSAQVNRWHFLSKKGGEEIWRGTTIVWFLKMMLPEDLIVATAPNLWIKFSMQVFLKNYNMYNNDKSYFEPRSVRLKQKLHNIATDQLCTTVTEIGFGTTLWA